MPQPVGSTSPSTAFAAMAASTAEPPRFSTSTATWVASGWLVAAIPWRARTSERVANGRPVIRSPMGLGAGEGAARWAAQRRVRRAVIGGGVRGVERGSYATLD